MMDESTRALVATHLTEIVIEVYEKQYSMKLTVENYVDSMKEPEEKRLSNTIGNIIALYKKVHHRVPTS